jgi:NifU-like protein
VPGVGSRVPGVGQERKYHSHRHSISDTPNPTAVTWHLAPDTIPKQFMSVPLSNHFLNPCNVGDAGEPCFIGRTGSMICGAAVSLSIQIDELQNVSQAKFRAAGCEVLVATLSFLTEKVQAKSSGDAAAIGQTPESLLAELGIPADKSHCVQVACDALVAAVRKFSEAARSEWNGEDALICTCFFVSEQRIEHEIQSRGLKTVDEVTAVCNAGGGCGSCQPLIVEIIESVREI